MKRRDLEKRMRHMRAEIAGENPTPLEVLLTERVVAGWLLVEVLEGATRRYLAAIRELAWVRKLQAGAPVHVNTQVNLLRG